MLTINQNKKLLMEKQVAADLENDIKTINTLKIERNRGNLTPEVIDMCNNQIDNMANVVEALLHPSTRNIASCVAALKDCPQDLATFCTFADAYDDVIKWNKLHDEGILPIDATIAHREMDIAMFKMLCDKYRDTYTNDICYILYCYAYRNHKV